MTFDQLVTAIALDLRDSAHKTFSAAVIGELVNDALVEIGRIAPDRFQVDITPTTDTLVYTLSTGTPEVEAKRVEVWDYSKTPHEFRTLLTAASENPVNTSSAGWEVWDGQLSLSNRQVENIRVGIDTIRVWGYGPYPLVTGATAMPVSTELEYALRAHARYGALKSMLQQRNLFTQWQTLSGNNDTSPASLMSQLTQAEQEWQRRRKEIAVLKVVG